MSVVLLQFPKIENGGNGRPNRCPHCDSPLLQSWGSIERHIADLDTLDLEINRYRCNVCERTFRANPKGIDKSKLGSRLRCLATLIQALGLSSRETAELFHSFGIDVSHVTIWRYSQEMHELFDNGNKRAIFGKYTLDRKFVRKFSPKLGVVLLIDLGNEDYKVLGTLNEHNPREVKSWLEMIFKNTDVHIRCLETSFLGEV